MNWRSRSLTFVHLFKLLHDSLFLADIYWAGSLTPEVIIILSIPIGTAQWKATVLIGIAIFRENSLTNIKIPWHSLIFQKVGTLLVGLIFIGIDSAWICLIYWSLINNYFCGNSWCSNYQGVRINGRNMVLLFCQNVRLTSVTSKWSVYAADNMHWSN